MKPTLSNIERRIVALEGRSTTDLEPMVLRLTVTTPEGRLHPGWGESQHEYKDATGRRVVCIMPQLLTPEQQKQVASGRPVVIVPAKAKPEEWATIVREMKQ